ncbi:MAG: response regulator, partial [Chlorobiaceae bacterium]|nr:response regulator [Chlorobiaceae bacterium]
VLSVTDDGSGISETNLPHIIEPYFTTKTPDKGSGLGLSTVYGIVRQNQGFICCRSEVGKGTTFDIYLPLHETFPHHDEDASEVLRTHCSCSAQRTILLVEDDSAILKLCRKVLEQSGFNILEASCPSEALRIAESFQGEIHLLLSDVVMPEMNGFELSEKLVSKRSGIKSLFMSGYTDGSLNVHAVHERPQAFIRKPFTLHALQSNVQKMF